MEKDEIEEKLRDMKNKKINECLTEEMFDHMFEGETLLIFQSQLTKSKEIKIQQRFLIKEIQG